MSLFHKLVILSQMLCIAFVIGDWSYTYDCDWNLPEQYPVELGYIPAMCYLECSYDCLPADWIDRDLILRSKLLCEEEF